MRQMCTGHLICCLAESDPSAQGGLSAAPMAVELQASFAGCHKQPFTLTTFQKEKHKLAHTMTAQTDRVCVPPEAFADATF